jgi:hypothetical protein
MLQRPTPGSVYIEWQLLPPVPSALLCTRAGQQPVLIPAARVGARHQAVVSGLEPGQSFHYQIQANGRPLGSIFTARSDPGPNTAFRFVAFGDSGSGDESQQAVARAVETVGPDLALLLGDIIYPNGAPAFFDSAFFQPYRRLLPQTTFWPALGNHDVETGNGRKLLGLFTLPPTGPRYRGIQSGHNYSFDYGNAHFAAIDSNQNERMLKRVVGPWLKADMDASDADWKFVFLHHPPYSSGTEHGSDHKIRSTLSPTFEQAGVDIVFAGHDHEYERTMPIHGVVYIVSGTGGGELYGGGHSDWTARSYDDDFGFTQVDIEGRQLQLQFINTRGNRIDDVTLTKD